MGCDEFSDLAAELALGVLAGRERADALAHLEHCGPCRERVRQLAMTGEELPALLPAVEPPPGFETRVMGRIGIARPARGFWGARGLWGARGFWSARPAWPGARRLLAVAVVTLAVLAAGLGGWNLRGPSASPLSSAALVAAGRQSAGEIYYHAGARPWMYMSVDLPPGDLPSGDGTVTCQLRGAGGRFTTVGWFRLNGGYGYWASPVSAVKGQVTGARIVSSNGTVLAAARFLAPGLEARPGL